MTPASSLWIGLHLPQACLDLSCPRWPDKPVVVLDNGRARLFSPLAAQAGVCAGMQQGSIQALCPEATLFTYQQRLEQQALHAAAMALLQYTPEIALADQRSLLLDVTASLRLFKGPRQLSLQIKTTLQNLGLTARIAMAPTARGAWLLASHITKQRRCLKLSTLKHRLDALPCSSLPGTQPYADWLNAIGCQTLQALRRLPRAALKRRTHPDILLALDQAYGKTGLLLDWYKPPPHFFRRIPLAEHTDQATILLLLGQRLIEQASGWLTSAQLAASQLLFQFEYEKGLQAKTPAHLPVRLTQASWRAPDMLALFKEHLQHLRLEAPVIAITLRIHNTQAMQAISAELFPDPTSTATNKQLLLERFCIRLGHSRVLQAAPLADHRPEIANHWVPISQANHPARQYIPGPRPFWLLDTPIPLTVSRHRPFYKSELRLVQGPERIEDGWWDTPVRRDYFIAQASDGSRYWIFQDSTRKNGGWFLHGLFG